MIVERYDGEYYQRYESKMELDEKMQLIATLFEGMGYDFGELKIMKYPPSNDSGGLWENGSISGSLRYTDEEITAYYEYNVKNKIKDISVQRKISFESFAQTLKGTKLEDFTPLLFITLASVNEKGYHPKVRYKYKHPTDKQKKLITKMLDIYPYIDKINYNSYPRTNSYLDNPTSQKSFEVELEGNIIRVDDYLYQKAIFGMLADVYKKQGLNQCFPYGENEPPDTENPFPITKKNLEEQKKGDQGGKNERNFIRDLAYRIHYLMHVSEWFEEIIPADFEDIDTGIEEALLKYTFPKKEAELISQLLFYFDLYHGERKGKRVSRYGNDYVQNLYMLIRTGEPQTDVIYQIEQLHPSYIRAMNAFYEKEYGWE